MAEEAPAPVAAQTKPTKKKATTPKRPGPSVGELIVKAVAASKERSGLSVAAIKKVLITGGYDVEKNKSHFKTALKRQVEKGILIQTKGAGASGSFKLGKKAAEPKKTKKQVAKKSDAAKKPAVKKAKTAKKLVTAKKPKSTKKSAGTKKSPKKAAKKSPVKKVTKKLAKSSKKVSPKKARKPKKADAKKTTKPKVKKAAAKKK